jgi:hypothetical protein
MPLTIRFSGANDGGGSVPQASTFGSRHVKVYWRATLAGVVRGRLRFGYKLACKLCPD